MAPKYDVVDDDEDDAAVEVVNEVVEAVADENEDG